MRPELNGHRLEFAAFSVKNPAMMPARTPCRNQSRFRVQRSRAGLRALLVVVALACPQVAPAQLFTDRPPPVPPASVPEAPSGPAMNLAPSAGPGATVPAPLTQPTIVQPSIATVPPVVPPPGASTAGQAVLSLTARYGKDLPVINSGLVWRVFADKPDDTGTFKLIREERGATP